MRCNYRDFRSATKTSGSEKNLRASLLVNYFRISMLPLVLLLCFASLNLESEGQADDAVLTTANDLFLQARQYESNKQYYLALRSFQAAYRLFPQDKRFLREARKLANYYRGKVKLYLENGQMLLLPVLYPNGTVESKPAQPGSADDLVASFFRQYSIPIFRNDSPKCAVHTSETRVSCSTNRDDFVANCCRISRPFSVSRSPPVLSGWWWLVHGNGAHLPIHGLRRRSQRGEQQSPRIIRGYRACKDFSRRRSACSIHFGCAQPEASSFSCLTIFDLSPTKNTSLLSARPRCKLVRRTLP